MFVCPTGFYHSWVGLLGFQDSGIFMKAAKIYFPSVHKDILEAGSVGERLGASASTLFYCRNYTAPLHCDRDECPGLSAQLDLVVDAQQSEYSFINMTCGIYFVARVNSFW
jgi:hypothetical protein